ncbi:branched-chain amino acid ABC transporter permease [Rhizobium etli]|uniref:branched-chain amino acid ABC transporter permease n=1 Tax=Rhizobium etli TaxID=29449 RepID=UPI000383A1B9|nr:branched-chain amino acid ABC transporter permease [Rhizobium etli]AGS24417.1 high-affinity branched-chain amino acid ABC transporter permease protein [Rhizobium etli bv. mimosae str. Mim1]
MTILDYVLQQLLNAVSLGSLYALVAVGLSIIFGIMRLTNFAHGDVMMVGAFGAVLSIAAGVPFIPAIVIGVAVASMLGILIERIAYRPIRKAPDVARLLTSLAVTYILENVGIVIFSSSPRNFPIPTWLDGSWQLTGGITLTNITLLTIAVSAGSLVLLGWFTTRTTAGLGMRGAAEDPDAAQLVGLNVNKLIVIAFLLASAYAGLAGVLWAAQAGAVDPQMGFTPLLKAFVAAIIGGFGSIAGALVGGYMLGALEILIVAFLPSSVSPYRDAIVFALLIAFLLFRPGGLLQPNREIKL